MSYTTVQNDVKAYLHRADLDGQIPTFIRFAENELNARLRHRLMEVEISETSLVDGALPLPSDFLALKWLENTSTGLSVRYDTPRNIANKPVNSAQAQYYTIEDGNIKCWPTSGDVQGVYYAKIPDLETNSTNWLDDLRHDLYVYMTLKHACVFIGNPAKAEVFQNVADRILKEVQSESRAAEISGAPLTQRIR